MAHHDVRQKQAPLHLPKNMAMPTFQDIKELRIIHLLVAMHVFAASMAPGFLALFIFDKDLFDALDNLRLILMSLVITSPVIAWHNYVLDGSKASGERLNPEAVFMMACMFTSFMFGVGLLLSFLAEFVFRSFVWTMVVIEFLFLLGTRIFKNRA